MAFAQAKDAFVNGLTQLINATNGTFGDEGPLLLAAVDAMSRGLAEWDARVAGVESGLRAEIANAAPPVAAQMRATLGTVYLERGRIDDALAQFSAALELDPSLAQADVFRGLAYERAGRSAEAAAAYRSAWQRSPGSGTRAYLALRSQTTWQTSASEPALKALASAVDNPSAKPERFPVADLIDDDSVSLPIFPPTAYARAFGLVRQGKYDDALVAFRDTVASDPLVTDRALQADQVRSGIAALRRKDAAAAIAALDAAAKRYAESSEVHRILGTAYAAEKRYDSSLSSLRAASRLNPRDERSRLATSDVLAAQGDMAAAIEVLRAATRDLPRSAEAHWQLGRLEQRVGDARAAQSFERAAATHPVAGAARLYAIAGQAHHAQFNVDAAADAYRLRVRVAPNDPAAHFDLGEVYRAQDKLDEALAEYLVAALLDPASAKTFAMIGLVQAAAGRDEEAVAMLRRAVTLDAAQLDARYGLSRALLRLGRLQEAQQELRIFEEAQAKAMDEQRRRFQDNQQKIDDVLKSK
jgi:tetratricopeptide (TPR) repeat protein